MMKHTLIKNGVMVKDIVIFCYKKFNEAISFCLLGVFSLLKALTGASSHT